ncbi:type IX secretion system periplasmic lipoprotein PorW/SprE [Natronoflexus pectinivorans]|uniref:Tetratricopeptide repeat protein n=1 Tax=Natronoflexus pectinivorans TaxID=682526 RepID=A0A4R2GHP0_9BACT|nr:tetratricopeptide repeat protein [Natronoflexus pectinivorans]TCO07948.1 tetratricopeptide repeat protein [Natronoflexus pectinivorans]
MTLRIVYISIAAFLLVSCSTQNNTWLSRNYHSITSKYNTLFNGEQSFKRGEQQLMRNHQDNFTHILSMFPYSGEEKAGAVKGEMDRAISKGHKIIANKSITARPRRRPPRNSPRYHNFYNRREFNRYMDDAFLLVGKAHLYNHEFNDALVMLDYVVREFPNQSTRFDALIWMARTRIEMGDLDNAAILLDRYDAMGQAPDRLYGEYMATFAEFHIRSGNLREAIPYMKVAADEASGRWNRNRRAYILAQLYKQTGSHDLAASTFRRVIRSSPNYEMELNARINYLMLQGHLDGNHDRARQQLYRQVNQANNREFRDRIYYVLAQSYLSEGDTIMAITNLRLSSGYNFGNQSLKTETYLQLAELYFELPAYIPSYAYYDSTIVSIRDTDPRYRKINHRHAGLKNLSTHFETITREDSLMRLAQMPEAELEDFILALIEEERQAQLNLSIGARDDQRRTGGDHMFQRDFGSQLSRATDSQGQWYFYNQSTISLGKMEFERRWGRRGNEDNWRRADKGTVEAVDYEMTPTQPGEPGFGNGALPVEGQRETAPRAQLIELPTKEELMADIPLTEEQKEITKERLANAWFQSGIIFLDHFNDPTRAIEMFRMFLNDFPTHALAEQAWFWAYMAYNQLENEAGASQMRDGLIRHFPDGQYAEFARNPQYAEAKRQRRQELNELYNDAFNAYINNRFNSSISKSTLIIIETEEEELLRKARLLKAAAYARQGNVTNFENELNILTNDFGTTREGKLAERWLAMMAEGKLPAIGPVTRQMTTATDESDIPETPIEEVVPVDRFNFEPGQEHFILIVVEEDADINRLLFNLADYNFSRFLLADYEIESRTLPDSRRLLSIGSFANNREAMDYYYGLRSNPGLLRAENVNAPMLMAGSVSNKNTLISTGETTEFRDFFSKNYLGGGGGITIQMAFVDQEPEDAAATGAKSFTTSDGTHWVMVVLPPRTNTGRVSGFLTSHALNSFNLRLNTRTINLSGGETVLLVEAFQSASQAQEFTTSLNANNFWNNQLRASNWVMASVSPDNFKIIEQEGTTEEYIKFYKE